MDCRERSREILPKKAPKKSYTEKIRQKIEKLKGTNFVTVRGEKYYDLFRNFN
jgi:methyl coenzyme M reductase subunit D